MEYKGYVAKVEFDESAMVLHGRVLNTRDVITFEALSVGELESEFRTSVDEYIAFCEERGEEPEQPFSGRFLLRVSPELHKEATIAAVNKNLSLNAWVVAAMEHALLEGSQLAQWPEHRFASKWDSAFVTFVQALSSQVFLEESPDLAQVWRYWPGKPDRQAGKRLVSIFLKPSRPEEYLSYGAQSE